MENKFLYSIFHFPFSVFHSLRNFRQTDDERATRSLAFASDKDLSAVFFDDRPDDVKPETRSFGGLGRIVWDAIKPLEDPSGFIGRNSDSFIFNMNLDDASLADTGFDRNLRFVL